MYWAVVGTPNSGSDLLVSTLLLDPPNPDFLVQERRRHHALDQPLLLRFVCIYMSPYDLSQTDTSTDLQPRCGNRGCGDIYKIILAQGQCSGARRMPIVARNTTPIVTYGSRCCTFIRYTAPGLLRRRRPSNMRRIDAAVPTPSITSNSRQPASLNEA